VAALAVVLILACSSTATRGAHFGGAKQRSSSGDVATVAAAAAAAAVAAAVYAAVYAAAAATVAATAATVPAVGESMSGSSMTILATTTWKF